MVLAGTDNGVFKSFDNGVNWTVANTGIGASVVTSFGYAGDGDLFAGTTSGVFRSSNMGADWIPANSGVRANFAVETFATADNGVLFAHTLRQESRYSQCDLASRCTTDLRIWNRKTQEWEQSDLQFSFSPGFATSMLFSGPNDLYVATTKGDMITRSVTGGVFKAEVIPVNTAVDDDEIAHGLLPALMQNYPNPFSRETTVEYTLSQPSPVRIELFNMLGQLVQVFENGIRPVGTFSITIDGSGLSRGIYLYRLDTGTSSQKRTMVVTE